MALLRASWGVFTLGNRAVELSEEIADDMSNVSDSLGSAASSASGGPHRCGRAVPPDELPPRAADRMGIAMTHRSRLCHIVIDVDDLDKGVEFWAAAIGATEEELAESSRHVYRRIILPDSNVRILLQRTADPKAHKERMHIDLETDDIDSEVARLEALGATRYDHQQERGYDFWVLQDPWRNEFCVLDVNFPDHLAARTPWPDAAP